MTDLYGWLHPEDGRAIDGLHARLAAPAPAHALLDAPDAGLGFAGQPTRGWSSIGADFAIAITGAPSWRSTDLQRIATERDHAAALRAGWERHGASVVQQIGGSFAVAILDRNARRALLAIDRMGIEGLCYGATGRRLVFARAADAIVRHPALEASLDPQSLYDYLYFHVVPSPQTIYAGVHKLEPGQLLEFADGKIRLEHHWRFEFSKDGAVDERAMSRELMAELESAVRSQCSARATGAFLSGGIDSSTVAGLLARVDSAPAQTFTIGFSAAGYDEVGYARTTARHFGIRQHEYYITPEDVAATVPLLAASYDEPFGNSSAVPAYCCARLARRHGIEQMLAGDGGDELFGGNTRYARQNVFERYYLAPAWLRERVLEPALVGEGPLVQRWPLSKARSYVRQAMVPLPDRLQTYNYFSRTPATQILHPDLLDAVDLQRPLDQLREVYGRAPASHAIDRMLFLDWKFTLADNDLRKVTRTCALAGVSVRYPWLDDRVVELSTRLPPTMKVRNTRLRWFVKRALAGFLPHTVINKPKHGFGLPFGVWMSTHPALRELAHDSLAGLRRRQIVRADYIDELLRQHRDEHAQYYGEFIWVLMMLELWLTRSRATIRYGMGSNDGGGIMAATGTRGD